MVVSEGALQIAEKRREMEDKGEKKRYIHLNAEFRRIARRDKKAFLSDQCKERENNRMEKTRALFMKIRDTKRTFHTKMGTIKDRNGKDLQKQKRLRSSVQFSSVAQSLPTLCDLMDCSMPGSSVLYYLPEFAQIHVH